MCHGGCAMSPWYCIGTNVCSRGVTADRVGPSFADAIFGVTLLRGDKNFFEYSVNFGQI